METLAERPFPPGDYPLIVVGSGPGGLQTSYSLRRLGVDHALISADDSPGGMFRHFPFFQRLLSWTKPYAPVPRGTRAYERYDWNSLLGEEASHRAIQPEFMDGTSEFPSRPEMEAQLAEFVRRTALPIRYGCRWEATRQEGGRFVLETSDGEYRAPFVVFAVGVAEPFTPEMPGRELVKHYVDTREPASYAGKRLFIIGKENSAFELASGLLQWASRIVLASPRPAKLSVEQHSLAGVRARYVQPVEDRFMGGAVHILNASIEGVEPAGGALRVRTRASDGGMDLAIEADEVIAATGFTAPLRDLPALGVATFGRSRLPAQTAFWESASLPGIYFAGTINQGAPGLKKNGVGGTGAVHGTRSNAVILAREIAERHFGIPAARPPVAPRDVVGYLLEEATDAPELWNQKGYLARVVLIGDEGPYDEGIRPLQDFVDGSGRDGAAIVLEGDAEGVVRPVAYIRRHGAVAELPLDPDPLNEFRGSSDARARLSTALAELLH
ncbi:MAG: NAD(P)-binding domain-containing protein [Candidatus Limnocylindrales bacterium]